MMPGTEQLPAITAKVLEGSMRKALYSALITKRRGVDFPVDGCPNTVTNMLFGCEKLSVRTISHFPDKAATVGNSMKRKCAGVQLHCLLH